MSVRAARVREQAPLAAFLGLAAGVYAVSRFALAQTSRPDVLAMAVTIDLTVFVPFLYWLLPVRMRGWPRITIVPVFLACVGIATLTLPPDRGAALRLLHLTVLPAELALITFVALRIRRGWRARTGDDTVDRIRAATADLLGPGRGAEVLAFELTTLWYALLSWRSAPDSGPDAFSVHRRTAWPATVGALLLAIVAETVPVHMLLARVHPALAWAATVLGIWGALWVVGDLRALQLVPPRIDGRTLRIRFGLRWRLDVPLDAIAGITRPGPGAPAADLRLALPGARCTRIELRAPRTALGPYGIRRDVRTIDLGVDEGDALAARLLGMDATGI